MPWLEQELRAGDGAQTLVNDEEADVGRTRVAYTSRLVETPEGLSYGALLLASTPQDVQSNVMTIAWATVGLHYGHILGESAK